MNEIVNKILLAASKFMPEIHLRQSVSFTCSACGPFTKNKEIIKIFEENRRFKIYLSKRTR